jgi:hypothetical protein
VKLRTSVASTERERESLHARIKELDLQRVIDDRPGCLIS